MRVGFNALLSTRLTLPPEAPRFYHLGIQALGKLDIKPTGPVSDENWDQIPVWHDQRFPALTPRMLPAAERLAKHGIRFLGQIAPFPPVTDGLPFGQPFWGQLQCALGS